MGLTADLQNRLHRLRTEAGRLLVTLPASDPGIRLYQLSSELRASELDLGPALRSRWFEELGEGTAGQHFYRLSETGREQFGPKRQGLGKRGRDDGPGRERERELGWSSASSTPVPRAQE